MLEDYDAALDAYNESIKIDPSDDVTLVNRGDLFALRGQLQEAETDYNEAINLNPSAINYNARGLFYLDIGLFQDAVIDFTSATELASDNAIYFNNVGYSHYLLGDYETALTFLDQSLALDSSYPVARRNRGLAYWRMGEYALCIADYTVRLSVEPTDDISANNRGLCHGQSYVNLGKWHTLKTMDTSLTDLGHQQAQSLRDWLKRRNVRADALYASSMRRTQETADYVSEALGLDAVIDHRLREVGNSHLDGEPVDEPALPRSFATKKGLSQFAPTVTDVDNAESWMHFRIRLGQFVEEKCEQHKNKTVYVVAHELES